MCFRPECTISWKVLVRYPMALLFSLLHLGMKRVHVVQVVVFVVALPSYQLLRSTSLLLDQPVVAVGAVCPEECSAAEMVGYVLHVNLRRLSHVVYLGKGRSIPGYAGKGADELSAYPLFLAGVPLFLGSAFDNFFPLWDLWKYFSSSSLLSESMMSSWNDFIFSIILCPSSRLWSGICQVYYPHFNPESFPEAYPP